MHFQVILSVGGWNEGSEKFSSLASDSDKRVTFSSNAVKFLRRHGFDGLDLMWQYPARRGGRKEDKQNFVLLAEQLR